MLGFAKEVGFYTVLVPTLDVRTPHCFYGAIVDDEANFTLLLEDMAPATPGVQADGCTVEQATGAVRNLAALHASGGTTVRCTITGSSRPSCPIRRSSSPPSSARRRRSSWRATARNWATRTPRPFGRRPRPFGGWTVQGREPFAVVHGDYRLDNLMFPPSGENVSALDWQNVSVGPPGRELAYFVGTAFEAPERRRQEDALVAAYHESLLARGVVGYEADRCHDDYRLGQLQGPLITVLGAVYATAEQSESADRMFLAMARRSCAAIRDLGSLELAESGRG